MKEQRSINLRPHEVIAKRDSTLFVALTTTLAFLSVIGFYNPGQAWVRASNDARGNDPAVVVKERGQRSAPWS